MPELGSKGLLGATREIIASEGAGALTTGNKLATQGLGARCIMIGGLTAGQFAIFDSMLPAIGIDKFHYHQPHTEH